MRVAVVVLRAPFLLMLVFLSTPSAALFRPAPALMTRHQPLLSSSSHRDVPFSVATKTSSHVTIRPRRSSSKLSFSTTTGDMMDDHEKMAKKIKGRKHRVLIGYRIATLSYLTASVLAIKESGVTTPFSCYTAAGHVLAAGMAYILSIAARKSSLASPTHKRLNIILGKYGVMGLVLSALVHQTSNPLWYGWTMLSFITMVNSIKGYGYGLKGWKLEGNTVSLFKGDIIELTKGVASTLVGAVRTNLQSTAFLASTLTAGTLTTMQLVDLVSCIVAQKTPTTTFVIASQLSRFSKLCLLTGASFTLTDGAMRGQLADGSTYNQLNFLSAFCFGTVAVYLKAQSVTTTTQLLVKASQFCTVMHVFFGFLGLVVKKKKEEYHDKVLLRGNAGRLSDDYPLAGI